MHEHDRILILDYGSQFTQLIARRVREARVYCEIHPAERSLDWIRQWGAKGIVLSGGPASVYEEGVPSTDPALLTLGVPILGICYGMQLIAHLEEQRSCTGSANTGGPSWWFWSPARSWMDLLPESGLQCGAPTATTWMRCRMGIRC